MLVTGTPYDRNHWSGLTDDLSSMHIVFRHLVMVENYHHVLTLTKSVMAYLEDYPQKIINFSSEYLEELRGSSTHTMSDSCGYSKPASSNSLSSSKY